MTKKKCVLIVRNVAEWNVTSFRIIRGERCVIISDRSNRYKSGVSGLVTQRVKGARCVTKPNSGCEVISDLLDQGAGVSDLHSVHFGLEIDS